MWTQNRSARHIKNIGTSVGCDSNRNMSRKSEKDRMTGDPQNLLAQASVLREWQRQTYEKERASPMRICNLGLLPAGLKV